MSDWEVNTHMHTHTFYLCHLKFDIVIGYMERVTLAEQPIGWMIYKKAAEALHRTGFTSVEVKSVSWTPQLLHKSTKLEFCPYFQVTVVFVDPVASDR